MSKAVMISIKPEWCEKIFSGKKIIEVRKTKPNIPTPFKCPVYCTKSGMPFLIPQYSNGDIASSDVWLKGNGKVIGEFVVDKIEKYEYLNEGFNRWNYNISSDDLENTCLSLQDFTDYGQGHNLYGWHITDVKLYDKPRELSEFKKCHRKCWYADLGLAKRDCPECKNKGCFLQRPSQSWCYVEEVV